MDAVCSGPKKERTIQTVTSNKSKSQGLSWYGVVSVPLGKGNLHFCNGTIYDEKYIEILEQHIQSSRLLLFQGCPCIFQQDNAIHSARITKAWLRKKRARHG